MVQHAHTSPPTPEQGKQAPPPHSPAFVGPVYVPTNQPFITTVESIQNAASGASNWSGGQKQPPHYRRQTRQNTTTIEYGRKREQQYFTDRAIFNLWEDVQAFSDSDADLLLYIFSAIIREEDTGAAWIWASHFLDMRGVRPIIKHQGNHSWRAGHRTENVAAIDEAIYRLSMLWITIDEVFPPHRKGGKVRVYRHQGRVLTVVETWSQHALGLDGETTERLPVAWKIRAGDWLMDYLQAPRYVALLCDQSLQYDPENEKWEKRLSRYFLFFLRINSQKSNCTLVRSVEELIKANSLPLDQANPQRSRQRLEKALARLLGDQQIKSWEYVPESTSSLPARRWLDTWLTWQVRITVHTHPVTSREP